MSEATSKSTSNTTGASYWSKTNDTSDLASDGSVTVYHSDESSEQGGFDSNVSSTEKQSSSSNTLGTEGEVAYVQTGTLDRSSEEKRADGNYLAYSWNEVKTASGKETKGAIQKDHNSYTSSFWSSETTDNLRTKPGSASSAQPTAGGIPHDETLHTIRVRNTYKGSGTYSYALDTKLAAGKLTGTEVTVDNSTFDYDDATTTTHTTADKDYDVHHASDGINFHGKRNGTASSLDYSKATGTYTSTSSSTVTLNDEHTTEKLVESTHDVGKSDWKTFEKYTTGEKGSLVGSGIGGNYDNRSSKDDSSSGDDTYNLLRVNTTNLTDDIVEDGSTKIVDSGSGTSTWKNSSSDSSTYNNADDTFVNINRSSDAGNANYSFSADMTIHWWLFEGDKLEIGVGTSKNSLHADATYTSYEQHDKKKRDGSKTYETDTESGWDGWRQTWQGSSKVVDVTDGHSTTDANTKLTYDESGIPVYGGTATVSTHDKTDTIQTTFVEEERHATRTASDEWGAEKVDTYVRDSKGTVDEGTTDHVVSALVGTDGKATVTETDGPSASTTKRNYLAARSGGISSSYGLDGKELLRGDGFTQVEQRTSSGYQSDKTSSDVTFFYMDGKYTSTQSSGRHRTLETAINQRNSWMRDWRTDSAQPESNHDFTVAGVQTGELYFDPITTQLYYIFPTPPTITEGSLDGLSAPEELYQDWDQDYRFLTYGWKATAYNWYYDKTGVDAQEIEDDFVEGAQIAADAALGFVDGLADSLNPLTVFNLNIPDLGPVFGHDDAYSYGSIAGTATGIVGSFMIGNVASGTSGLVACGSALQKAAKLYTAAQTTIGVAGAAYHYTTEGKIGLGDVLALAPAVGYLLGKVGKALGFFNSKCFVAGTQVMVTDANGSISGVAIENIKPGDLVWSRDENDPNAPLQLKPVTAVERNVAYDLQLVSLKSPDGNIERINATDAHPFYVEGRGWVGAADLAVGDHVLQADGQSFIVLANADDKRAEGVLVFNFAVADNHTYYVEDGAGARGWAWVHNNYNSDALASKMGDVWRRKIGDDAAHIVAAMDGRAAGSREILREVGIHFNDAVNGIWLPRSRIVQSIRGLITGSKAVRHQATHSDAFHKKVFELLDAVRGDRNAIEEVLKQIAEQLKRGILPV